MDTSSRKTEIMGAPDNRSTMIMDGMNGGSRATEIMTGVPLPVSPAMSAGIEIDGYKIESVLAENTGEATLLLGKKQDVLYVIKIYHQKKRPKGDLIEKIRRIDSEYVIASVADGEYDGRFYEVLPYFKNGDLIANLPISEKTIEEIVVPCVNEGLHSLHEQEIVHRDVKPSNIFFDNDKKKVVIGDFGISSVLKENMSVRATSMSRTLGYAAPETSAGFISKESDYYSFGITLWHLVLGQDPFLGMNDMQILYQTINKKISLPQTVTPRLSKLIYGLTAKDRNERWGYEQVCAWLNHADAQLPKPNRKALRRSSLKRAIASATAFIPT